MEPDVVLYRIGAKMEQLTISVPEAGRRLGIRRNTAYEAARQGQIPTIRIGRRVVVPVAALEAMLAVKSKQEIVAAELVRRLQRDEPEAA
jgi:excisionase family DNA binding protein